VLRRDEARVFKRHRPCANVRTCLSPRSADRFSWRIRMSWNIGFHRSEKQAFMFLCLRLQTVCHLSEAPLLDQCITSPIGNGRFVEATRKVSRLRKAPYVGMRWSRFESPGCHRATCKVSRLRKAPYVGMRWSRFESSGCHRGTEDVDDEMHIVDLRSFRHFLKCAFRRDGADFSPREFARCSRACVH